MADDTNDTTYNGWTNYPSWAVYTWLTNEETLYHATRALCLEASSDYSAGDALKAWVEDHNPLADGPASWYVDLLQWAIDRVNFAEVAHALREE